MSKAQKAVFTVPDVSCEHCVNAIDKALKSIVGVETVSTDLVTKKVYVTHDTSHVALNQLEAALDDAGYTVEH